MTELLWVDRLTKRYSTRREIMGDESSDSASMIIAVDSVSFKLARAETLGIVGQSGSGKSTIAKLILRLEKPSSGRILFDGLDVHGLKGKQLMDFRARVQMIFQDPYASLDPRLRIRSSLEEPLIVHGIKSETEKLARIDDVLTKVRLTPPNAFYDLRPHQLSGGQRQRVAIARSLILGPDLIVADEPVSMLDVSVSAEILNLMLDLKETTRGAYIFITHNLAHAAYFCDRIMVMNKGAVVEEGPSEKVLIDPRDDYTRRLIASLPSYSI